MTANLAALRSLPDWVPDTVRLYLAHTAEGRSLREIARGAGVHASTVLRQVRRFESRRDDPLVDCALGRLQGPPEARLAEPPSEAAAAPPAAQTGTAAMPIQPRPPRPEALPPDGEALLAEARRLLPLLATPATVMAVAADMPRAAVLRETTAGTLRLAVLDRPVAEAFALRDWIACHKAGRVAQYGLTAEGRAMLRKLGVEAARPRPPAARQGDDDSDGRFRSQPESPVAVLARRRDAEGRPFLSPAQVAAADRLREDFEIARMAPGTGAGWDTAHRGVAPLPGATPDAALTRVQAALAALGPGLGDVVLRCCCWQEGVETAEQKLGWSARSGKIVLRIALARLAMHYDALGEAGKLMG